MLPENGDGISARPRRRQVKVVAVVGRKVSQALARRDEVLDLRHEDVDGGVEPLRDGVVERGLEALLLAHDDVEKVAPVDVGRLRTYRSPSVTVHPRESARGRRRERRRTISFS